jgi:hypothetical protein
VTTAGVDVSVPAILGSLPYDRQPAVKRDVKQPPPRWLCRTTRP